MNQTRLEARFENRIYYFYVTAKAPEKISISMYSTDYTFLKNEKGWENASANKNAMAQGLVDAVLKSIFD